MKKQSIIISVFLLTVILASPSFAQPGRGWEMQGGGQGGRPGWGGQPAERGSSERGQTGSPAAIPDFFLMDLNLTSDQASGINALRDALTKDIRSFRDRVSVKEKDVKKLREERPDLEELIQAAQNEIFKLKKELQDRQRKYVQDVRDILTPEQNALIQPRRMGPDGGDAGREMGPGREPPGQGGTEGGMGRRRGW